ncbi:MAG: hypothetical protein ISS15_15895 [Alphaproteobacteria bacterium]|nr:hypothetical protein [Alphaproteobacteria bacterium]MBL7099142.1 hypothetical protein [Alphaproteobacteria bacterium]
MSIAERLARRRGPRSRVASKAITQSRQAVDPQIAPELNRELRVSPSTRRGAPKGNKNRLVHGRFTAKRLAFYAEVRAHVRHGNWLVRQVRETLPQSKSGRRSWPFRRRHIVDRIDE